MKNNLTQDNNQNETNTAPNKENNVVFVEKIEVFASGLPNWNIEPPAVVIRRKKKK